MTAAGIAAGAHEDRHDIQLETGRTIDRGLLDDDGHLHGLPAQATSNVVSPSLPRVSHRAVESHQGRIGQGLNWA